MTHSMRIFLNDGEPDLLEHIPTAVFSELIPYSSVLKHLSILPKGQGLVVFLFSLFSKLKLYMNETGNG